MSHEASMFPNDPFLLPKSVGLGFKSQHFREIVSSEPDIGFFEIHAENFMGAGGEPHFQLAQIRDRYPLSVHGVGLSIGGPQRLDCEHLTRLHLLVERYKPASVSEHLAWSRHNGACFNTLLPIPYNTQSLSVVVDHVHEVQDRLRRHILIENPAGYFQYEASTHSEIDFLREISLHTGCGLLLDVTNVYVSAVNNAFSPEAYLDTFPMDLVEEIHISGYGFDKDDAETALLIDAHCSAISLEIWHLYRRVISRAGPIATLLERDNEIPTWNELFSEARRAASLLTEVQGTIDAATI